MKKEIEKMNDSTDNLNMYHEVLHFINFFKHRMDNGGETINWSQVDENKVFELIEAFNTHERTSTSHAATFPATPAPSESSSVVNEPSSKLDFAKRSLAGFVNSKMPSVPISAKQMKDFKINFKIDLLSMNLEHVIDKDFTVPEEGDLGYRNSSTIENSYTVLVTKMIWRH